jgi:hypothetical protein
MSQQQIAHLVDLGEARQDGAEALMLPPRLLEVDDVVVQELLAVGRGDREELVARGMADHGLQRADLRRHPYPAVCALLDVLFIAA